MSTPVTVAVYPFRSDAEIASARLAADGIRSAVRADDEGGLSPGFFTRFGVRVEVDESDLTDAYESLGIDRVVIPGEVAQAIYSHAVWAFPLEACGLIAVDGDGTPAMVFCLTNTDASERRFTIDPAEHFGCVHYAQSRGWRIGGVFHSHTRTEAYPSGTDIEAGGDPDWFHVIVGPIAGRGAEMRAFRIVDGSVSEASTTIEP